jgi:type IV secretory pathway VirJ component
MNKLLVLFCFFTAPYFKTTSLYAQNLPVKEWGATIHNKPLVFYISGDGGMNKFSNSLCKKLNSKGFDVIALNARTYFWDKKNPGKTTADVTQLLRQKLVGRKNQQIILIGYSFGADVLPFILNRLTKDIDDKVLVSFLIASSGTTDFEIHWADIFGENSKRSMDVVSEINRLKDEKVVIISASDDKTLDVSRISLKRFTREVLPGGHHFDGDTDEIVKVILNNLD